MSRQPSNRNQRSKRIKVKHVLQIFLLLAVCFWLIYQVKHSHDKKKEFDESDVKASISRGGSDGFIRLGRKDIHPQEEDTIIKNEKHDEEAEEEETTGDVDENKHEEDELEHKKVEDNENEKVGDDENEKVGGGDDEIEDHGQEKLDSEVDREEDFVDGEKEGDDDDENENENEEKDPEDGGQMEKESSIERGDHDGDDTGTHEAREEHYKADDASSAVTNDAQVEATVNEDQNDENVNGHPENILEETDTGEKRKELEEREVAMDEKQSNVTIGEVKENVMDGSDNGSSLNTTVTEVSDDHLKTSNNSMQISTEIHDQEILSEGTSLEKSNLQNIDVEQAGNSTLVMDDNHIGSNSTDPDETKDAELNTLKSSERSNDTYSSTETNDAIDAEKSDADDGANESLESENTENSEEIQEDSINLSDSSHSLEETNTRLDPDTLPEIQTEGTDTEDAASE